jgi:uncharacterized membrane protein
MILSFGSPLEFVRFLVGAALVLWLPGYAVTAALFRQNDLGGVDRILITLGSSISLVILIGLGLHLSGLPLTGSTWAVALAAVTLAAGAGALLQPTHRPALPRPAVVPSMRRRDSLLFGLAALLVVAGLGLSRIGAEGQPQTGFTELSMTPINNDSVRLGVQNEESGALTYRVVLQRDGAVIAEWPTVQLGRGQAWEMQVRLPVSERTGVELVLYRADAPGETYRRVAFGPAPTSGT